MSFFWLLSFVVLLLQVGNCYDVPRQLGQIVPSQPPQDSQGLDESDELEALESRVKYPDAAREALLKVSAHLRGGRSLTNVFLKVIVGMEKIITELQAALETKNVHSDVMENILDFISMAATDLKANTNIVRLLTARGLFLAERLEAQGIVENPNLACLAQGALKFLVKIRNRLGEKAFEEYLGVSGLVTLMFVMDNTGSMAGDIRAAIAIAKQIATARRNYDVDYILSPFNDPTTGPITVKNETQGAEFVSALEALHAHGGGDCPELVFKGMIDALKSGPRPGSFMYVFTDASPKDATNANINTVLDLAKDLNIKINFFTQNRCGGLRFLSDFDVYKDVAQRTGGKLYPLNSTLELRELGDLVAGTLEGAVPVSVGGGNASSGRQEYRIVVDDTIEKLAIIVSTQNEGVDVELIDPNGNVTDGRITLAKGVVYSLDKLITGDYRLIVLSSAGEHTFRVMAVSGTNVDFGHLYVLFDGSLGTLPVPLTQPLQGLATKIIITLTAKEPIQPDSLRVKVVDKNGAIRADKALTAVGTSGIRFYVIFHNLPAQFRLQLHGKTKKGNSFVRLSACEDRAVAVLLKLTYAEDNSILPRGQKTIIELDILRGDVGQFLVKYTLTLKDERDYGKVALQPSIIRRGKQGHGKILFDVPANAPAGKTEKVQIYLARQGERRHVESLTLYLLIV